MQEYPSVDREIRKKTPVYVFDKLDGSNIRAEWSKKNGWYKFGSRRVLLGADNEFMGKAIQLFRDKYGEDLEKIFRKQHWQHAMAFFEFWGPQSFAGTHAKEDNHHVTLFDIYVHKKGLVLARDFLKLFGKLDHAELLYHGNASSDLVDQVKNGTLEGMTFEGVVCKGGLEKSGIPLMFKIKNDAWLTRLKEYCAGNEKLYQDLS